jgi:hypothetical protein
MNEIRSIYPRRLKRVISGLDLLVRPSGLRSAWVGRAPSVSITAYRADRKGQDS